MTLIFLEVEWERWQIRDSRWPQSNISFPQPLCRVCVAGHRWFSLKLSLLKFLRLSISMLSYSPFSAPRLSLSHPISLDSEPQHQCLLGTASFWKQSTKCVSSDSDFQLHHL